MVSLYAINQIYNHVYPKNNFDKCTKRVGKGQGIKQYTHHEIWFN